jgi:hypothetical protein
MVAIRIWKLVAVGVVLAWFGQDLAASDAGSQGCDKEECQRRAKAAFAFARLAETRRPHPGPASEPAAAPMPRLKSPRPGGSCPCGEDCGCAVGACPMKCPAPAPVTASPVTPAPPTLLPVLAPPVYQFATPAYGPCVGGSCPPPRVWYPGRYLGR